MTVWIVLIAAVIIGLYLVLRRKPKPTAPAISFGPTGDGALEPDELERLHPLSDADRQALTQENIEAFDQGYVDQIYQRCEAGPIPDGPFHGSFFFAEGGNFRNVAEVLGGVRGKILSLKLDKLTDIGEMLWQGKVFYRDAGELRNIIDKEEVVGALFGVDLDRMRREEVFGDRVALLFPAKLYSGDSQFDPRRPSVIIDYAETASIDGFIPEIDTLGGKDGLMIRDEIRMIRPGFYLGRAYFGTLFGLNFTLFNADAAG